ncbi:MAG: DUF2283 domain-containing protein [Euryarchaeota archaeon]|nr:DUF2283 domain-containing protein [Euryarchaeota archaeon]
MKIDYDKEYDIIYLRFSKKKYSYSEEKDNIIVDYDKEGKVIAIEILDASRILKHPIAEIMRIKEAAVV